MLQQVASIAETETEWTRMSKITSNNRKVTSSLTISTSTSTVAMLSSHQQAPNLAVQENEKGGEKEKEKEEKEEKEEDRSGHLQFNGSSHRYLHHHHHHQHPQHHHHHHLRPNRNNPYPLPIPWKSMPHFILGVSTGHTASTSLHEALVMKGCPWHNNYNNNKNSNNTNNKQDNPVFVHKFENVVVPKQILWDYNMYHDDNNTASTTTTTTSSTTNTTLNVSCQFVSQILLPKILQDIMTSKAASSTFSPHFRYWNHSFASKWQEQRYLDIIMVSKRHRSFWSKTTYMDLGHYQNRGQILECLALLLKEKLTLIRIRRHRHDIAYSFATHHQTPCIVAVTAIDDNNNTTTGSGVVQYNPANNQIDPYYLEQQSPIQDEKNSSVAKEMKKKKKKKAHPRVTTCPRSTERIGTVALPVLDDTMWDSLTTFQKFLWYADEMELRWYRMKQFFQNQEKQRKRRKRSPNFYEVTWSTSTEFRTELQRLRQDLHCTPLMEIPNLKQHTNKRITPTTGESMNYTINSTNNNQINNNYQNIDSTALSIQSELQQPPPQSPPQKRWMTDEEMIRQDGEYQRHILNSWQQRQQQQQQRQKKQELLNPHKNDNSSTGTTVRTSSTVADTIMDSIVDVNAEQLKDILFWSQERQHHT
jgi:ribosomal protein L12E/L44/L45/RPP1/RPP2